VVSSLSIREEAEKFEKSYLSPVAALSSGSRGRSREETPCRVRTAFQRDRDRIIHSKAFRRLKHKTQVFIAPEGDHYRTRLTHTLEVSQIARTAARALRLNEDLTEAAALGHDLGHTPFGHAGEEALNELLPGGFRHNEQSLRVVDFLEQNRGLNLTDEVREGILKHTGKDFPETLEGQLVKICDRLAYINHDIDDAMRSGVISTSDLPREEIGYLGSNASERVNTMVTDLIYHSREADCIQLSPKMREVIEEMRRFMFEKVYVDSVAKSEEHKAKRVIKEIYYYFLQNPAEIPHFNGYSPESLEQQVCDYIAGMTDRYIISLFQDLFVPRPWEK